MPFRNPLPPNFLFDYFSMTCNTSGVLGNPLSNDKEIGCFTERHQEKCSDLCDLKDKLPKMRRQRPEQRLMEGKKKSPALRRSRLESRLFKSRKGSFLGPAGQALNFIIRVSGEKDSGSLLPARND
jgi:hypothetical protein